MPSIGTTFWFDLPLKGNDADELLIESERKLISSDNDF